MESRRLETYGFAMHYGRWARFPVNPDRWYEKLAGRRPATFVPKGRTFALTRQLGERLAGLDGPRRADADRLALYRAFHTVGVELAERGDEHRDHLRASSSPASASPTSRYGYGSSGNRSVESCPLVGARFPRRPPTPCPAANTPAS